MQWFTTFYTQFRTISYRIPENHQQSASTLSWFPSRDVVMLPGSGMEIKQECAMNRRHAINAINEIV